MYLEHFGLQQAPFAITPDPRFVFLSSRHEDALAHLVYGVGRGGGGGFVQLTGEVGTGKTTLCRLLLEQVPEKTHVALILNPVLTPKELVAATLTELEVPYPKRATHKRLIDILNDYLLDTHAAGERVVLVIDEAQTLSPQALEQVRLLTNLETATEKLLQIILIGQPELRDLLARRDLRQLSQRVTARFHLTPLQAEETRTYVWHRLQVAGARHNPFSDSALRTLHRQSQGVPRLINIIAERCLLAAYATDRHQINAGLVRRAAAEIMPRPPRRWLPAASGIAAILVLGSASALIWQHQATPELKPISLKQGPAAAGTANEVAGIQAAMAEPVELLDLPSAAVFQSQPEAERALAAQWGVQAPDPAGCAAVPAPDWRCVKLQGNADMLQQIDLPALLQLSEPADHWVLVTGIDENGQILLQGSDSIPSSWEQVGARWSGTLMVLFPVQTVAPVVLKPNQSHAFAHQLRRRFELQEGSDRYDDALVAAVTEFQRRQGLPADGVVGPGTLLLLGYVAHTSPPRLSEARF